MEITYPNSHGVYRRCQRCGKVVGMLTLCGAVLAEGGEHIHTEQNTDPIPPENAGAATGGELASPFEVSGAPSSLPPHDRNFMGSGVQPEKKEPPA